MANPEAQETPNKLPDVIKGYVPTGDPAKPVPPQGGSGTAPPSTSSESGKNQAAGSSEK